MNCQVEIPEAKPRVELEFNPSQKYNFYRNGESNRKASIENAVFWVKFSTATTGSLEYNDAVQN